MPNSLDTAPAIGVIIAPPAIPIIINDDTSLEESVLDCNAIENKIENTFAHVSPTNIIDK